MMTNFKIIYGNSVGTAPEVYDFSELGNCFFFFSVFHHNSYLILLAIDTTTIIICYRTEKFANFYSYNTFKVDCIELTKI